MGKMTFVFEYEDGKEPPVSAGMSFMGGKIVAASFRDALEDNETIDNEMASEGLTVDIIVSDLKNGGPISSALTGNFAVKRNNRSKI
ncbi:hypothetical protein M5K26_05640 [Enterobacter hormaechei subsp. xiangfangensis]|uniref:hypothetical protein n=1 Tax=Enterobacter hormaechei TaxID=158836 RepID=UPI001BCF94AF|nr:hypothetical protein [Enterobacter hormaechei]UUQ71133.1 hypothetical protein M5K26_05640 [Enterobacter hormaechei subsp. xiangfangensis]